MGGRHVHHPHLAGGAARGEKVGRVGVGVEFEGGNGALVSLDRGQQGILRGDAAAGGADEGGGFPQVDRAVEHAPSQDAGVNVACAPGETAESRGGFDASQECWLRHAAIVVVLGNVPIVQLEFSTVIVKSDTALFLAPQRNDIGMITKGTPCHHGSLVF